MKSSSPKVTDSFEFRDEFAVADGRLVISHGRLTPEALESPTMQAAFELLLARRRKVACAAGVRVVKPGGKK